MKNLIILIIAIVLLGACSTYTCPTYSGVKKPYKGAYAYTKK